MAELVTGWLGLNIIKIYNLQRKLLSLKKSVVLFLASENDLKIIYNIENDLSFNFKK